jgi:hypothetical protein
MCDPQTLPFGHEMAETDKGPVEVLSPGTNRMAVRCRPGTRPHEAEDDNYGPDLLEAASFGASLDEIRHAAVTLAGKLYGDDAQLVIEEIGMVRTTRRPENQAKGPFNADVRVRCVNFTELGL